MTTAADESQLMGIVARKEYLPLQDELRVFFDPMQESEGIKFLKLFMRFQKVGRDCTHIHAKLTYRLLSTSLFDIVGHWMTDRFYLKYAMKGYAVNLKRKIEIWG